MSYYVYLDPESCKKIYPSNNGTKFTVKLDTYFHARPTSLTSPARPWRCGLVQTCFTATSNAKHSFYVGCNVIHDSYTGCGRRPVLRYVHVDQEITSRFMSNSTHPPLSCACYPMQDNLLTLKEQEVEFSNVFYMPLKLSGFDTIEIYLKSKDWEDLDSTAIGIKSCVLHFKN